MKKSHCKKLIRGTAIIACATLLVHCGGGKDDDNDNKNDQGPGGTPSFTGARTDGAFSLRMQFTAAKSSAASAGLNLQAALPTDFQFYNKAISSGPPDNMTVRIQGIYLTPVDDGPGVPIYLAAEEDGTPLPVRSGAVDISALFTKIDCLDDSGNVIEVGEGESCDCGLDADGALIAKAVDETTGEEYCPEMPEGGSPPTATMTVDQTGPFRGISVQLNEKVDVKGCVSGNHSDRYTITGEQTYCTRTSYDYENISNPNGWVATDFQAPAVAAAEPTVISMGSGQQNMTYNFSSPLTLSEGATPQLTMLLDLNRVLRFNNGAYQPDASNADDQACRPLKADGGPCGPLFYALRPNDFMYVFVGEPGRIEGYAWITRALDDTETVPVGTTPTDFSCEGENACIDIAGWMTMVYEPGSSTPFFISLNPDDDNALTVVKGGNTVFEQDANGSFEPRVDAGMIAAGTTTGTFDLNYGLGQDLTGVIKNFTPQTAVQTDFSGGAHFELERNSALQYGEVFFKREL